MSQFRFQATLPKFAVPQSYDLRLSPDLIAGTFAGTVTIDVEIVKKTRWIVLNAVDLSVNRASVSFTPRNSPEVSLLLLKQFDESQILVLEFCEFLPEGEGVLKLAFNGLLNDETMGFCRCTYEHNGDKKHIALTQFEPANARRCFPCWDEPDFKATFKITLQVPPDLVVLSNMHVLEEKINGNLKIVSYHESPVMSTYLVAIVVGSFDYIEDHTYDGIQVRVYCQVGKAGQAKFAVHVGLKTLDLFQEYFDARYPLPKLDMIAIPNFAAESTEIYGLIAYLEKSLLYNEQAASEQMVTLQQALFSGYWNTSRHGLVKRPREEDGATKGTENNTEDMEIFADDVVMNKKTGGIGVVSRDKLYVYPIATKARRENLREDEVVVVWRKFLHGQNVCSVTSRRNLGVICGTETKVDLSNPQPLTTFHCSSHNTTTVRDPHKPLDFL